ncbi:MAG TPA: cupin domain-containing protein [Terriglobales bacterium]|nr:cupin domain-containing protein [Terriglobales bacterium]
MKRVFFEIAVIMLAVFSMGASCSSQSQDQKTAPANTSSAPAAPATETVRYFSSSEVKAGFDKASTFVPGDGRNYKVIAGRHDTPGKAELHTRDTDVFYIVDGTATFVTGGKIVDAKITAPEEVRGSAIDGGEAHLLNKGDIIVIPPGTPHWFKTVQTPPTFLYFVVKIRQPEDHPYPGAVSQK